MTTKIEWTDETWNPVTGCTKVSQGCKNCYAERLAPKVFAGQVIRGASSYGPEQRPRVFTDVLTHPNRLDAPLHWRKPRRIFVNSMSDLFHEDVPIEFIGSVLGIAAACEWHTFQVLTKRPQRMLEVLRDPEFQWVFEESNDMHSHTEHLWPPANVWLGVSVEDQATADERIPLLLQTPAAVRFLSCEPLLGPIDLARHLCPWNHAEGRYGWRIDWVIAGGESGPKARPSHPDWFRWLRDQCAAAGTPYFFKQWGEHLPRGQVDNNGEEWTPAGSRQKPALDDGYARIGKKKAGRTLDGRLHDEYPPSADERMA